MNYLVWDIETNGLHKPKIGAKGTVTPALDRMHCAVSIELGSEFVGKTRDFQSLIHSLLAYDGKIVGHNIAGFDIPTLGRLTRLAGRLDGWEAQAKRLINKTLDTRLMSRLLWPEIKTEKYQFPGERSPRNDFERYKQGKLPGNLMGRYSLEAMGYRIGELKGTYAKSTDWQEFTSEMLDYCIQDVRVNVKLLEVLLSQWDPSLDQALQTEQWVAYLIALQEENGIHFDKGAALDLERTLLTRVSYLRAELRALFPAAVTHEEFTPKVNNPKYGYTKGVPIIKTHVVDFNPGSRQHIAQRLVNVYGWKPTEFTKTGLPEISEEVLEGLTYPGCDMIKEYLLVSKRLSQVSTGKQSWLAHAHREGTHHKIYGGVDTTGSLAYRMSHNSPNLAQVPSCGNPYGTECRSLFMPPPGFVMVGCDASGLEARILAHFLHPYDKGAFASAEIDGRKEDKTDGHSIRAVALGMSRDDAKTWFYGYMYGAGDLLLGGGSPIKGKRLRKKFEDNIVGFKNLRLAITQAIKKGYLFGLDKRRVPIRSPHAALNVVCQGAGALVMKYALVLLHESFAYYARPRSRVLG